MPPIEVTQFTEPQKQAFRDAVAAAQVDSGGKVPDAQIPATVARDAEVAAAITAALASIEGGGGGGTVTGFAGTGLVAWVDDDDQRLFSVDSAGNFDAKIGFRDSLRDRLAVAISDYGYPKSRSFNEGSLREARVRIQRMKMGDAGVQLPVAMIGDSITKFAYMYSSALDFMLTQALGDAGFGYFSFGGVSGTFNNATSSSMYGGARSVSAASAVPAITARLTGTFTSANKLSLPDRSAIRSTTVGNKIELSIPAGAPLAAVKFFSYAGAGNALTYRINAGAETPLDLSAGDPIVASLAGFPTDGSAFTLTLTVAGTGAVFGGINFEGANTGVRTAKLGISGSTTTDWAPQMSEPGYRAALRALQPALVSILLGTNDRESSDTLDQVRQNFIHMVEAVRSAVPHADILLVAPPENGHPLFVPINAATAAVDVTAGDVTLSAANYAAGLITVTGTNTVARTITFPAAAANIPGPGRLGHVPFGAGRWIVTNNTTQNLTLVKTGATSISGGFTAGPIVVPPGDSYIVGANQSPTGAAQLVTHGTQIIADYAGPPMATYQDIIAQVAADYDCAFLNLQYAYGASCLDYVDGTARSWISNDTTHPTANGGGRVNATAIFRAITG